jgi:hypothetical protein
VTATNLGPAAGPVQITDQLPDGLELLSSASPADVACQEVSGDLVCSGAHLGVGQTVTVNIETRVIGAGAITNTATVSGGDLPAMQTANATIAVSPSGSDLAFTGGSPARLVIAGIAMLAIGSSLVASRRRERSYG